MKSARCDKLDKYIGSKVRIYLKRQQMDYDGVLRFDWLRHLYTLDDKFYFAKSNVGRIRKLITIGGEEYEIIARNTRKV